MYRKSLLQLFQVSQSHSWQLVLLIVSSLLSIRKPNIIRTKVQRFRSQRFHDRKENANWDKCTATPTR